MIIFFNFEVGWHYHLAQIRVTKTAFVNFVEEMTNFHTIIRINSERL